MDGPSTKFVDSKEKVYLFNDFFEGFFGWTLTAYIPNDTVLSEEESPFKTTLTNKIHKEIKYG